MLDDDDDDDEKLVFNVITSSSSTGFEVLTAVAMNSSLSAGI
jgi:hypothetical protein